MNIEWVIEMTRRCRCKCDHCLRGAPQRKDIDSYKLRFALKRMNATGLTLTGGEPLLNLSGIRAAWLADDTTSIYIATSGNIPKRDYGETLDLLNMMKNDNHVDFSIDLSSDPYHPDNRDFCYEMDLWGIQHGMKNIHSVYNLIRMGRAHDSGMGCGPAKATLDYKDEYIALYMTVDFDVFIGCDWSYQALRKVARQVFVGNALQDSIETIEKNVRKIAKGREKMYYTEDSISFE